MSEAQPKPNAGFRRVLGVVAVAGALAGLFVFGILRDPTRRDDIPSAMRDDWEQKHTVFHTSLLSACGSPILTGLCGALLARAELYRRMSVSIPGVKRDVVREHRDILDATLARRPEEAVQALREHYQRTADAVRLFFDRRQEPG